jgi:oxygen-independent coproporphyrinogen III oxidase
MSIATARAAPPHTADLLARLGDDVHQGYTYGYPHKTAYRPFSPALPLADLWSADAKSALDLYVHIPFCEMRCGFCNLFTTVDRTGHDTYAAMLQQIDREAEVVSAAVGRATVVRMAIGGGTPTILSAEQLDTLLSMLRRRFALSTGLAIAVEASPETTNADKLAVLRAHGVSRLSLGVQTFDEQEAKGLGRPQRRALVEQALRLIADAGFETRNIDLIYGGRGQTAASFIAAIDAALAWVPDEICLYPLYVRPLTGLGRVSREKSAATDNRLAMFRAGRDHLLERGFEPANMRLFRRRGPPTLRASRHKLMTEGTIGLGCGARSLTSEAHYSSEYAVGRVGVRQILDAWLALDPSRFGFAHYGVRIGAAEQRRRHVVLALLESEGLSRSDYLARYGRDLMTDHPELAVLGDLGFADVDGDTLRLTTAGLERSDAIGPWLYSHDMRARMEGYTWR